MPAPYDYTIQAVNPLQSFLQGVQTVDTLQKREQEIAAQKAAQQQLQQRQALMAEFQAKAAAGKLQSTDFDRLTLLDPANYKAWSERAAQLSTEKKDSAFNTLSPVYAALYNQQPDIAKARLQTELVAAENAQDASRASQIKAALQLIETPEGQQAALLDVGTTMFGLNPDRMKSLQESLNTQGTAGATRRKAVAEATKSEVDAEFARKEKLAALDKAAAELGLSQANKNKVLAETRKLGIETQQAALALEALKTSGGVDPEKKFAQEEKIRKEWQGRNKVYSELQGTFSSLKESAASSNGPGDIALITGFMKMLDPGSVVRETEFATARDTAGLYTQLQNRLQKAKTGELLDANQRKQYVDLAAKYLKAAQNKADQEKQDLDAVVKNYKLNPENVFGVTKNITVDY